MISDRWLFNQSLKNKNIISCDLVRVDEVMGVGLADFQLRARYAVVAGLDRTDLASYLALRPSHAV